MDCHADPLEEDPLFKVKPVKTGVETDSSNLDRAPYREGSGYAV